MFYTMIQRAWKNLRIQNQILIFQSIIVVFIFVILTSLCLYLVNIFSIYIKQEFLQQLIIKSMISTLQISVFRVDRIGQIGYNQQIAQSQSLRNLYDFQVKNNISMTQEIEDCLQSPHSKQFYSYQFCYGFYGKKNNQQLELAEIKSFISLQNQFISIQQAPQMKFLYNIYLDDQLFFSQYKGEYKQILDESIMNAVQFMKNYQQNFFFAQLFNQIGQVFLTLNTITGTKIVLGYMYNQTEYLYYKLTQSEEHFKQRSLTVLQNGVILTDTSNFYALGMNFQNTSVTGFDEYQFQKIKNSTFKNYTVINECQLQLQNKVLCLLNINKTEKLIFSKFINTEGIRVIVMVDTIFLQNIKEEFNNELKLLIDQIILSISLSQIITLIICILLQIAFIKKLNKPLHDLQDMAKSHMNNLEQNISRVITIFQTQNQTQKLANAFFNLINLSHKNRQKEHIIKGIKKNKTVQYHGNIFRRNTQKIINLIKRYIKQIRCRQEN